MEASRFFVLPGGGPGGAVDHVEVEPARVIIYAGREEIVVPRPLPHPKEWVTVDVQHLVQRSGLKLGQIAWVVNETCRTSAVTPELVWRWCMGSATILQDHLRVLGWLAGFHCHNLLIAADGTYLGYYVGLS